VLGGPAAGLHPLNYQWHQNSQLVPGANHHWLPLADLSATSSGSYTETVDCLELAYPWQRLRTFCAAADFAGAEPASGFTAIRKPFN
jgi:hypothetical protein